MLGLHQSLPARSLRISGLLFVLALSAAPALAARYQVPPAEGPQPADEVPIRTWRAELDAQAPDFTLHDLEGQAVTLSKLHGKTVVLEWFNPRCPIVKAAHRAGAPLANLGNEMHQRADVTWLAINSGWRGMQGAGLETNREGSADLGMIYPVLLDESGWVGRMYGATSTPQMFIISPSGKLVYAGGHDDGRGGSLIAPALHAVLQGGVPPLASTRHFGCGIKYAEGPQIGSSVADVQLLDLLQTPHRLSDYRGQPLVLEWFNPTCPFVVQAHEDGVLKDAAARWAARGVAWLSINSAHSRHATADVRLNLTTREEWGLVHPLLLDSAGKLGRMLSARTSPQIVILDERGVLRYSGAHDDKEGHSYVDRVLLELQAGKPVSVQETDPYGCRIKYASR